MSEYYAEPESIEDVSVRLKEGSSALEASATEIDASRKKIEQSDSLTAYGYASLVDQARRGVSRLSKRESKIASVLDTVSALYVDYESQVINALEDSTSAGNNYSSASRHQVREVSESHAGAGSTAAGSSAGQTSRVNQDSNTQSASYTDVGKWLQQTSPALYEQICNLLNGGTATTVAGVAVTAGAAGVAVTSGASIKRGMSARDSGTSQGGSSQSGTSKGGSSQGTSTQTGGTTSSGSGSGGAAGSGGTGTTTSGTTNSGTSADASQTGGTGTASSTDGTGYSDGTSDGSGTTGTDTSGGGTSGSGTQGAGTSGGVSGADTGQGSDWVSDALNDAVDTDAAQAAQGELTQAASSTNPEATASGSAALSDSASVAFASDEQSGFSQLLSQWGTGLYEAVRTYGVRAGLLAGGAGAAYASSGVAIEAVAHCAEFVSTKCVPGVQGFMSQVSSVAHVTRVSIRMTLGNIVQGVSSLAG